MGSSQLSHYHSNINAKNKINLDMKQCYAPTNGTEDDTKEDFYQQLQNIIVKT